MFFCIILFEYKVLKPYKSADKSIKANTDKSVRLCYFAQCSLCNLQGVSGVSGQGGAQIGPPPPVDNEQITY